MTSNMCKISEEEKEKLGLKKRVEILESNQKKIIDTVNQLVDARQALADVAGEYLEDKEK